MRPGAIHFRKNEKIAQQLRLLTCRVGLPTDEGTRPQQLTQSQVIRDLAPSVRFNRHNQRVSARVASHLTGNVLASDSEPDVEFAPDSRIGFAGFASMSATLNQKRTASAKRTEQTVAGAVEAFLEELTLLGFEDGAERNVDDSDTTDDDDSINDDGSDSIESSAAISQ